MRYKIWKGREKKSSAGGGIEPLVDRVKKTWLMIYHLCHWSWWHYRLCCASCGSSCTLIDRCLVQSAVSNLFPNQWHCLKLYLPLPVCLICHCVFWIVILFSNLSLCFLTCYFVFEFVIVFSDLLFCFRICHCVFWIVILFFIFAFAFVICYFVFRIVFCFALVGHRNKLLHMKSVGYIAKKIYLQCSFRVSIVIWLLCSLTVDIQ